jgi:ATP-dependent RNA helicase RhlE
MSFDTLGLRGELLKAIKSKGYETPTPVQERVIPAILRGQDILARAQTGTGKTDAFALPIVDILSHRKEKRKHPRALILAPTRELANQVGDSIKAYGRRVSIRCSVVYGGVNIAPQIDRIKRGIDILVATPGRLLDLADHRGLNLGDIEFLVFDEADRMLDLGFSGEISQVLELVPSVRKTMLFSATYTSEIRNLAQVMLRDPEYIEVAPDKKAAEFIDQKVHLVDKSSKRDLLIHLIRKGKWTQALIFVRTKHGANKLTERLVEKKISASALHGNKSQSIRTRTLKEFKNGEIQILVATDVAARGLDISNLPHVVNYDMPHMPEDYIHRIGRTGRAGISGIAISFVCQEERVHLKAIEKLLDQKIPREEVSTYTQGGKAPDFVLYRPGGENDKKAPRDLQEFVNKGKASKPSGKKKSARKSSGKKTTDQKATGRWFDSDNSNRGQNRGPKSNQKQGQNRTQNRKKR